MATLVLQAVGGAIGGIFGPVGAAVGSAIGSSLGYAVDQAILNPGKNIEGARLSGSQPMTAEDGAPMARVYGYCRVSTTVIWATKFQEKSTTERQGGKGLGSRNTVTTFSYSVSAAFGISEGEIAAVKRIWADGKELDLRDINYRVYKGSESQQVDPLISLKQGPENAPAFKGTAYLVIENLELERFGNRLPQIQVEVIRPVGKLEKQIKAITIIPGATEFGYAPEPIVLSEEEGETIEANRHILHGDTDWQASIDELQAICPNLEHVSLVVAWYCDDLRAGHAKIRPGVVRRQSSGLEDNWQVNGFVRTSDDVLLISKVDGRSAYGGTPSDQSVIDAIRDLKNRGLKVTLNPFILMDVAPDNVLPDPYSNGVQSPYPWRGRISVNPAIGRSGTPDKTGTAQTQIDAFYGAAGDMGYRRFIEHNANLAEQAGGVDTFLIGSEMRGLTQVRDQLNQFPFVDHLIQLAANVRQIVRPQTHVLYGADWSEYFGYHPSDGSGDVFFHLDPLWASSDISAIGIDNYMPLSDWRSTDNDIGQTNLDGALWQADTDAFETAINSGEGYDWFYASAQDRKLQIRTPITDGAYQKPWTFRYKDLISWWQNRHYNRIGGIEASTPTAWQPQSKQIYFTEVGCPAIDVGANQPNVFVDPKSSENNTPYFSSGARDDVQQRAFLQAHHTYWSSNNTANPISNISQQPMVGQDRLYVWTWDARPYPAFPLTRQVWGDGDNWLRGHWLNGRVGTAPVSDLVQKIMEDHGVEETTCTHVDGSFNGLIISAPSSIRSTLQPILSLAGAIGEDAGAGDDNDAKLTVSGLQAYQPIIISSDDRVDRTDKPLMTQSSLQADEFPNEVQVYYRDALDDYQSRSAYSRRIEGQKLRQATSDAPAILEGDNAQGLADKILALKWAGRKTAEFSLPLSYFDLKNGDVIYFSDAPNDHWLIERITFTDSLEIEARRIVKPKVAGRAPKLPNGDASDSQLGSFGGPPLVIPLDLPQLGSGDASEQFRVAVRNRPFKQHAVLASSNDQGFEYRSSVGGNATIGRLNTAIIGTTSGRFDNATMIDVIVPDGEFETVPSSQLFAGSNLLAVQSNSGEWEIVQYLNAVEVAPNHWQLSGLLRGQGGTEDAMQVGSDVDARVVKLDRFVGNFGIRDDEIGRQLNFKIGQSGKELSDRYYKTVSAEGGLRALKPLSPVHLKAKNDGAGNITIAWIRRGRVNADSWLGPDIPLGEEIEVYDITLYDAGGETIVSYQTSQPSLTLISAQLTELYGAVPSQMDVSISQISQRVGRGIAARKILTVT